MLEGRKQNISFNLTGAAKISEHGAAQRGPAPQQCFSTITKIYSENCGKVKEIPVPQEVR